MLVATPRKPIGSKRSFPGHRFTSQEFNTSNENYSEQKKRMHEEMAAIGVKGSGAPAMEEEAGIPLGKFADDDLLTLDALKATGKVRLVEGKSPIIEHAISESGDWHGGCYKHGEVATAGQCSQVRSQFQRLRVNPSWLAEPRKTNSNGSPGATLRPNTALGNGGCNRLLLIHSTRSVSYLSLFPYLSFSVIVLRFNVTLVLLFRFYVAFYVTQRYCCSHFAMAAAFTK